MTRAYHFRCPNCDATLGVVDLGNIVTCPFCEAPSLTTGHQFVPEYSVRANLDEVDARRVLQRMLGEKGTPSSLLQQSRFHSATLYYAPYHELYARRMGTVTVREHQGQTPTSRQVQREDIPHKKSSEPAFNTRVVMSDITRIGSAIRAPGWALDQAEIAAMRSDPRGTLHPMNRSALQQTARVFTPTESATRLLEQISPGDHAATYQDSTEYTEVRIKRIYYPIWRLRYKYRNRLYNATIDGVTGRIMAARVPHHDRARVLWLLGTAMPVAFIAGKLIRALISAFLTEGGASVLLFMAGTSIVVIVPVFLTLMLIALMLLGLGWEQFRYPTEIVICGDVREPVKIKPATTNPVEKMFQRLSQSIETIIRGRG